MNINLYSHRFVIKTLDHSNAERVLNYFERNQDFFAPWLSAYHPNFFTNKFQKRTLRHQWSEMQAGRLLRFFIFHREDKKLQYILGDIHYSHIFKGNLQSCLLGYKIDRKATRNGVAFEAVARGNRYMFEQQKLHRIEAAIMPNNEPSLRLIHKLGFREEGLSKRFLEINGKWEDHQRFALLKEQASF